MWFNLFILLSFPSLRLSFDFLIIYLMRILPTIRINWICRTFTFISFFLIHFLIILDRFWPLSSSEHITLIELIPLPFCLLLRHMGMSIADSNPTRFCNFLLYFYLKLYEISTCTVAPFWTFVYECKRFQFTWPNLFWK